MSEMSGSDSHGVRGFSVLTPGVYCRPQLKSELLEVLVHSETQQAVLYHLKF